MAAMKLLLSKQKGRAAEMRVQLHNLTFWQAARRAGSRCPASPEVLNTQMALDEGICSTYQIFQMISEKYRSVTWAA